MDIDLKALVNQTVEKCGRDFFIDEWANVSPQADVYLIFDRDSKEFFSM